MSDFATHVREDQRLLVLQQLRTQAQYTAHEHLLREALQPFGHRPSADQMRANLAWLDEQGLIVLAQGEIWVATLTLRGEDVATGSALHPGVARQRPGGH